MRSGKPPPDNRERARKARARFFGAIFKSVNYLTFLGYKKHHNILNKHGERPRAKNKG